jgi:transposase-like protein
MKSGPHTRYKPAFIEEARQAYEAGACDKDVAARLNIDVSTLYRWRKHFPDFAAAIAIGKGEADRRVEQALYRRATGFEYKIQPDIRVVLPDARTALQWLRIRQPDRWRLDDSRDDDDGDLAREIDEAWQRVLDGRERDAQK